jgi:Fe-S oxidoreductase
VRELCCGSGGIKNLLDFKIIDDIAEKRQKKCLRIA